MTDRKKQKKIIKLFLDLLLAVFLFVIVFSGYRLYRITKDYKEGENAYDTLRSNFDELADSLDLTDEEKIRELIFPKMKEENDDFTGWIRLEDSAIDYPVMHTDNNEFYLYHLFNKEYNRSGCVFLDAENAEDFSDKNMILYAHHMRNGTMFHDVVNYEKQEYYDSHKVIRIYTMTDHYDMFPVAGMYTTGNTDYLRISFSDDEDFMDYVQMFLDHSTFQSEESITASDQTVLLSTCAYNVADGRYALIGKLVKK